MKIQKEIRAGAVAVVAMEISVPCDWAQETMAERVVRALWWYLDKKGVEVGVEQEEMLYGVPVIIYERLVEE